MIRHEPLFSREEKFGKEKLQLLEKRYDTGKDTNEESLDISKLTRITDNDLTMEVSNIDISPDNQTIVFQAYATSIRGEKYFNIWSVRASDGKGMRFITNAETNDFSPRWTSDGNFIIFASSRSGATKIWKVRKNGSGGFIQITSGYSTDGQPDVSFDGKKIVFSSISPVLKSPHIWVMNADGTDTTELCEGYYPRWTPDGKKIVFISTSEVDKKPVRQLWVMNSDGTNITQILNILEGDCLSFSISPNGKTIVFSSNMTPVGSKLGRMTNNFDIWLVNIDGTGLTQLTTNLAYDGDPVWSSDSKYIYFCSNRGMKWDIWRIETSKPSEKSEQVDTSIKTISLPEKIENITEIKTEVIKPQEISESKTLETVPVDNVKVEEKKVEQPATTSARPSAVNVKKEEKKTPVKKTVSKKRRRIVRRPLSPADIVVTPGGGLVILTWKPSGDASKIGGYFIYRTRTSGKDYKRVNKNAFKGLRFVDPEVENGVRYYYVLTSIDKTGRVESYYSKEFTAFPEHSSILKAREEAKKQKTL